MGIVEDVENYAFGYFKQSFILFDKPGKDGKKRIEFTLMRTHEELVQAYKILGQDAVQDNFEGCIVVRIGEVENVNMVIGDFK